MCQGLRSVFLPESFGPREPGGSFDLGMVAIMLGVWCLVALVLCLTTFRWTTKRDG
jgi:ABC-2 type transport system permease protein